MLPQQQAGTIWEDLQRWDGDGLLLDAILIHVDLATVPAVGEPLKMRGIVRQLPMLDRGASFTWRSIYGPGTVEFTEDAVRYRNTTRGNQNGSLLRAFPIERSDGASYTVEGVFKLVNGYAHDNNRVGLYLFGDKASAGRRTEEGALAVLFNLEGGTIGIYEGLNGRGLAAESTGRRTDSRWFGSEVRLTVDLVFKGAGDDAGTIDIVATLTDDSGAATSTEATVEAGRFTGDWFGFATRTRSRNYGIEGAYENAPWVVDYQYFWVLPN